MSLRTLLHPRSTDALQGTWLPVRMTAVLLLLNGGGTWYVWSLIVTLAGLGLVYHTLLRTPAIWLCVTLAFATWILRLWPLVDNHQYLAGYWSLAILLALCLPDPRGSLEVSARWLLALVFLWAALWKGVLSPDYRDGRFFTVRLMSDARFEDRAVLLSGLSVDEVRENRDALTLVPSDADADADRPAIRPMKTTPRFRFWVQVITWAVLAFEAGLALVFLLPWRRWTDPLRHGGLMVFCLGTFAFAPVRTFGWLLLLLGLATVPAERTRLRALYVTVWFLIAFVSYVPWEHFSGLLA